jgi:hypothetical protein
MPLQLVSAPALEPVTVADMRLHSRIIDASEDANLAVYIAAARRYAETYCGRSFITQQWKLTLDAFPGRQQSGYVDFGSSYSLQPNAILLDKGDVISVDSIQYTDMAGATQTLATTEYVYDLSGCPARLAPAFGKVWIPTLPQIGAVRVTYTAGYGAAPTNVPEGIRHWIMMRAATIYENREEVAILARGKIEPLPYVDSLLDPYSVVLA